MYKIGEYIVHASLGVSLVKDILSPDFEKDKTRMYYLLVPYIGKEGDIVYSPVEGGKVFTRKIMSPLEAEELISKMPKIAPFEVKQEKQRREAYKKILAEPYPANLVSVIKTAYMRHLSAIEKKRSFPAFEGSCIASSRAIIEAEISLALGVPYAEAEKYIIDRVEKLETA